MLLPSEWYGNFTCPGNVVWSEIEMNITRTENIDTTGSLYVDGMMMSVTGSYATALQVLILETDQMINTNIMGKIATNIELDGRLVNALLIKGKYLFKQGNTTLFECSMELHRRTCRSKHFLPSTPINRKQFNHSTLYLYI